MSSHHFTDDELISFLDEQLAVESMTAIETELRSSTELRQRVAELVRRRESGEHSVGEVWRHARLSCPTRATLGSYLLGVLEAALADYIQFHLNTIGCRYCQAAVDEMQARRESAATTESNARQKKFFESSVGVRDRVCGPEVVSPLTSAKRE